MANNSAGAEHLGFTADTLQLKIDSKLREAGGYVDTSQEDLLRVCSFVETSGEGLAIGLEWLDKAVAKRRRCT